MAYGGSRARELWLPAYTTATATLDLSHVCNLHTPQLMATSDGSLTHWVRPGIKPESSWMLVGFINHWATKGSPFFFFKGHSCGMWKSPGLGSNRSYNYWPTPQSHQHQIRTASATYTTAQDNARFLTHWSKPGIELESSLILIRLVTAEPQQELLYFNFF